MKTAGPDVLEVRTRLGDLRSRRGGWRTAAPRSPRPSRRRAGGAPRARSGPGGTRHRASPPRSPPGRSGGRRRGSGRSPNSGGSRRSRRRMTRATRYSAFSRSCTSGRVKEERSSGAPSGTSARTRRSRSIRRTRPAMSMYEPHPMITPLEADERRADGGLHATERRCGSGRGSAGSTRSIHRPGGAVNSLRVLPNPLEFTQSMIS